MVITTIIVSVLVSVTSIATDTWNRSRSELRAARQAKAMVDSVARDLEALVVRSGNENEWLSAVRNPTAGGSTNASALVFFTAAPDRYDGKPGAANSRGDVSCVGYSLYYKDPIGGGSGQNQSFVLNRHLVDPDETFDALLGKTSKAVTLESLFQSYESILEEEENFICENVFQFTVTFHVDVTNTSATPPTIENKRVTIGPAGLTQRFSIKGTGIETNPPDATLRSGRVSAVGISLTVLSDPGMDLLRKTPGLASNAEWLSKNSYQYSKLVQLPGM